MSQRIKAGVMLGVFALAAACTQNIDDGAVEEFVVVEPMVVTEEPTFTGKFK